MDAQCIITGVILYDRAEDVAYNGDLFQMGDVYICNCNEASAMTPDEGWQDNLETKWIEPVGDSFNRRGVWVFRMCHMSAAAVKYLKVPF